MPLASGLRLGAYEVQHQLGAGGMGEVYRARDTRLNRDVALKVLPPEFTQDADRLARFMREAQLLASLNHPNIAAIYGLEESARAGGPAPAQALVLELVEGPTLADRIAAGPLPLDEALAIAWQIADALAAAHEQGIVHRDLKPANVKVRPDGRVKVLDFGLAKLTGAPEKSSASGANNDVARSPTYLPTMSPAVTAIGVVLGTAAYMSPEQAKGRPTDKRADVWAFGCVLYEMLTGSRPFAADDVSGTIAAILERQPAWDRLPASSPSAIRRLLRRCLEKDPARRLRDIGDAQLEIDERTEAPVDPVLVTTRTPLGLVLAAVLVTALATAAIVWYTKPAPASPSAPARFLIAPAEPIVVTDGVLVMSRDGRRVAYAAGNAVRRRLFVREIDQFTGKSIPETEGAVSAAFSPDGQSLAFVADRKLRTVALAGGSPLTLRDRVDGAGLAWTTDQFILYNPGTATGIWKIPTTGGEPVAVTQPGAKDNEQRFPELLPNGEGLLFSARGGVTDDHVYVESLPAHERRMLVKGAAPHYLPTGHLAFVQDGTLFAVRFDVHRLVTTGTPVTLLEGIAQARTGQPLISYADAGSIVYVPTAGDEGSNTRLGRSIGSRATGGSVGPAVRAAQALARRTPRRDVAARQGGGPLADRSRARDVQPADGRQQRVVSRLDSGRQTPDARRGQGRLVRDLLASRRRQPAGRTAVVRQVAELSVLVVARWQGARLRLGEPEDAAGHPPAERGSQERIAALRRDAVPRRRADLFARRQMDRVRLRRVRAIRDLREAVPRPW